MTSATDALDVLRRYPAPLAAGRIESLGSAGGLSGSRLWRVVSPGCLPGEARAGSTTAGVLCLRRWPREHPTPARLAWIHGVLRHAAGRGVDILPIPILTGGGESFVRLRGYLWELTPWLPGEPDHSAAPPVERTRAAATALARLHLATATFLCDPCEGPSPGVIARRDQLDALLAGRIAILESAIRSRSTQLDPLARRVVEHVQRLGPAVLQALRDAAALHVRLIPCLRDIRYDHVLFDSESRDDGQEWPSYKGDAVTGIVDMGAMNVESVSADLARLAGSLAERDEASRAPAIDAYSAIRPLTAAERVLVDVLDRSGALLSGIHWIEWMVVEAREFDDPSAPLARMQAIVSRLDASLTD